MKLALTITVSLLLVYTSTYSQHVVRSEFLARPTNSSITISISFDEAVYVRAHYGLSPFSLDQYTTWQKADTKQLAEIIIDSLFSSKEYYYIVEYCKDTNNKDILNQPLRRFRTAKGKGEPFTFVIQADPHLDIQSDTLLYALCLQNQYLDNPDFMVDLGDILMTDKLGNAQKVVTLDTILYRCNLLRSYYETVNHSYPLFVTLGNHEGEAGWNLKNNGSNFAVWSTNERKKYLPNPYPNEFYSGDTIIHDYVGQRQNYYAFTWGDALFVVLDPYWYTTTKPDSLNGWRWTLGKVQYDWLRKTLESSTSSYKFIFSHQLVGGDPDGRGGIEYASLYEWGGNNLDGTRGFETKRPGWYKPIKDILKENKATIFFHGHDHFFAKQEMDCLIYQECPQPSHPNFSGANSAKDYGYLNGQIIPNSGHLRVKVHPNQIQVDYVRAYLPKNETSSRKNRDVAATYTIPLVNCYDSVASGITVLWNDDYVQNNPYPNPFQESIIFPISIHANDNYWIRIFDTKGILQKTIASDISLQEGVYQAQWNGLNEQGIRLPSGAYVYTISTQFSTISTGQITIQ